MGHHQPGRPRQHGLLLSFRVAGNQQANAQCALQKEQTARQHAHRVAAKGHLEPEHGDDTDQDHVEQADAGDGGHLGDQKVQPGDRLVIGDGEVEFTVAEKRGDTLRVIVSVAGLLESRKGVKAPGVDLPISCVSDKDHNDLDLICELDFDYVALSFVRTVYDIKELQDLMKDKPRQIPIVAKIEKKEAIDAVHALASGEPSQASLRRFEKTRLRALGYGLTLDREADSGRPVEPQKRYAYVLERGPVQLSGEEEGESFSGRALLAIAQDDFSETETLVQCKQLMRMLIQHYLGGQRLSSRRVFMELQEL